MLHLVLHFLTRGQRQHAQNQALPARENGKPVQLSPLCKVKRNANCLILQEQVQLLRLVVQCCGYIYNQPGIIDPNH